MIQAIVIGLLFALGLFLIYGMMLTEKHQRKCPSCGSKYLKLMNAVCWYRCRVCNKSWREEMGDDNGA